MRFLSYSKGRLLALLLTLASSFLVAIAAAGSAAAATAVPHWSIRMIALPSHFSVIDAQPGNTHDNYTILVTNDGGAASNGAPVVVHVAVPPQLKVGDEEITGRDWKTGEVFECTPHPASEPLQCTGTPTVAPDDTLEIVVTVKALTESGAAHSEVSVTGGGAEPAGAAVDTPLGSEPVPFAIHDFSFSTSALDGSGELQAAGHPYEQTTSFELLSDANNNTEESPRAARNPRAVSVTLPEGFVGDPQVAKRCSLPQLADAKLNEHGEFTAACPNGSSVGFVTLVDGRSGGAVGTHLPIGNATPLYNVIPEAGHAAEFGFTYLGYTVVLYADLVYSEGRYRVRVTTPGVPAIDLDGIVVTIYGDPGARDQEPAATGAFVTNPAHCSDEPLTAKLEMDSWEEPHSWIFAQTTAYPQITGCDLLQFNPAVSVTPEQTPSSPSPGAVQADSPSGYAFDIKVPNAESPWSLLSSPPLRGVTLTLPAGMSVSPSAASGLEGCPGSGPDGFQMPHGTAHPDEAGEGEAIGPTGLSYLTAGNCPDASKIGEVEVDTPLLEHTLIGGVFVASPPCGGDVDAACSEAQAENGEMIATYIEAKGSGVDVKLRGSVEVGGFGAYSQATGLAPGQLRVKFLENPSVPVNEIKVRLSGGPRAALATPQTCGTAATTTLLEPWSTAAQDAEPSSTYGVVGCAARMPFGPSFTAGTLVPDAGGSSPFTMTVTRHDGEQDLSRIKIATPPGVLARLSSVVPCPEPQASRGTCGAGSEIGHVNVAAGPGSQPFWVEGTIYLTGPYKGAPFGASIVVPAKAGPFNLGEVVTRATLNVDPQTAAATVTSDPLPRIIDGVPLRIRTVTATLDRPGFMVNPTNCSAKQITASITGAFPDGTQGSTAAVSAPYAMAGCKALPFKPSFTASTQGRASKVDGASLTVKVAQRPGEANIQKVDLQLPIALPSRLTTLQKACTEAQFDANPAGCPSGSVIGTATAITPLLAVPLKGPAILVSHGGAAFPDVEFLLQGQGVQIVLDGKTNIKKGITYSRFETVPDAPITSFETRLPEGPHSILSAYIPKTPYNLCGLTRIVTSSKKVTRRVHGHLRRRTVKVHKTVPQPLLMPTTITGQNGSQITQNTKIAVTGCTTAKAKNAGHGSAMRGKGV